MRLRIVVTSFVLSAVPATGWSCSACAAGDPKTAGVYLGMTVMMSALPLLMIGGLGYWLWRRHS
jgi:hypothetical protein